MSDKEGVGVNKQSLYERLVEIDALKKCLRDGCLKSGLAPTFHEDAGQEIVIEFLKVEVDDSWGNGQCVGYGKKIASRVGQLVRRRMSQPMVIPQDAFQSFDPRARQSKLDVSDELTDKTMASEGVMNLDEHDANDMDIESSGRAILAALPEEKRNHVDEALKTLPRSLIYIVYRVVVLEDTVEYACEQLGVNSETGERYVQRIEKALAGKAL